MASFQCHRPAQETYETKGHDNSFGHKVSEMAGKIFKGHHSSSQGQCYGQTNDQHALGHSHGLHLGQNSSQGVARHGKTEKKLKNKCDNKKKEKSHRNNKKHRDGNRSSSDSSSDSD